MAGYGYVVGAEIATCGSANDHGCKIVAVIRTQLLLAFIQYFGMYHYGTIVKARQVLLGNDDGLDLQPAGSIWRGGGGNLVLTKKAAATSTAEAAKQACIPPITNSAPERSVPMRRPAALAM